MLLPFTFSARMSAQSKLVYGDLQQRVAIYNVRVEMFFSLFQRLSFTGSRNTHRRQGLPHPTVLSANPEAPFLLL